MRKCGLRKVEKIRYSNKGGASELNDFGVNVCNFCVFKTGLSTTGDELLYSFDLEVPGEAQVRGKSLMSGNAQLSDLINEEFPDSSYSYYSEINFAGGDIWAYS